MASAVTLSGISKQFGQFQANRNITLSIASGSIHAIVGENGAGKSTLTRIIYGMLQPTSGTMEVDERPVRFTSPHQAIQAGIGMVHQHFMLVSTLTVTENIILGDEKTGLFSPVRSKEAARTIDGLARRHGLEIDPEARVSELSVGQQQRVEILKLLYRKSRILIFDEPTAVLSPSETDRLFASFRSLRAEGKTIVLITHKLDEVLAVADQVSVMRKGELAGTVPAATATREGLARMMVGRSVLLQVDNPWQETGQPVLVINGLSSTEPDGTKTLQKLSLTVHAGEIYGIAGVEGNGQSELQELLWGVHDRKARIEGTITLCKEPLIGRKPSAISAMGVSLIPEDRLKTAVVPEFDIAGNLLFGRHREPAFHRGIGFNHRELSRYTEEMIGRYDIRCDRGSHPALASLSGGNQQKIVLAREIQRPGIRLLVLAQPTRGVDIGAIELIHKRIIDARMSGIAILLISSELDEIIALSTRIGCIFNGTIRHEFTESEVRDGRSGKKEFEKDIGLHIT